MQKWKTVKAELMIGSPFQCKQYKNYVFLTQKNEKITQSKNYNNCKILLLMKMKNEESVSVYHIAYNSISALLNYYAQLFLGLGKKASLIEYIEVFHKDYDCPIELLNAHKKCYENDKNKWQEFIVNWK
jgi:hypothetical protein